MFLVLFHLPEDGGWEQSVDYTVDYTQHLTGHLAEMQGFYHGYHCYGLICEDGYFVWYEYVGRFSAAVSFALLNGVNRP